MEFAASATSVPDQDDATAAVTDSAAATGPAQDDAATDTAAAPEPAQDDAAAAAAPAAAARAAPLRASEKIALATELKDAGNALFKAGDYKRATSKYARVFCYVDGLQGQGSAYKQYTTEEDGLLLTEAEEAVVKTLKVGAHANLAACHLKRSKNRQAIAAATKALLLDPTHTKSLYRIAQGHMAVGDLDNAKAAAHAAARIEPNNAGVRSLLRTLQSKYAALEKRERRKYAKVFGASPDLGPAREVPVVTMPDRGA